MSDTAHHVPATGTRERRAYDRLSEDGRAIFAAWHDRDSAASERLHDSFERALILEALGYDSRPDIGGAA